MYVSYICQLLQDIYQMSQNIVKHLKTIIKYLKHLSDCPVADFQASWSMKNLSSKLIAIHKLGCLETWVENCGDETI